MKSLIAIIVALLLFSWTSIAYAPPLRGSIFQYRGGFKWRELKIRPGISYVVMGKGYGSFGVDVTTYRASEKYRVRKNGQLVLDLDYLRLYR